MSEHTPQHHHDPAHPVDPPVDPTLIDLVAGDPPVPVTVWRTARTDADTGRAIGARLAYRLVAAYSRPGDGVIDLTTDHALTSACATGGRRHHAGWFTDASSLIIGPPTRTDPAVRSDNGDLTDTGTWFGDDLTDADLPPSSNPAVPVPDGASLAEATSLVVACWPLDTADVTNRIRLAWLLTACARLLRPGGCLILVVTAPVSRAAPQDFTPVVQAAAAIELGYLQHIVAVTADTCGDAFVYHVTDEELLALATQAEQPWTVAHLQVHADLLVFTHHQAPTSRRNLRAGGGRRG